MRPVYPCWTRTLPSAPHPDTHCQVGRERTVRAPGPPHILELSVVMQVLIRGSKSSLVPVPKSKRVEMRSSSAVAILQAISYPSAILKALDGMVGCVRGAHCLADPTLRWTLRLLWRQSPVILSPTEQDTQCHPPERVDSPVQQALGLLQQAARQYCDPSGAVPNLVVLRL